MKGVVIDSSLWIPSFRGSKAHQEVLRELESTERMFIVAPIAMELRAGATSNQLPGLEIFLDAMPSVPIVERFDFKRAGEIFRACRERGLGVRSLIDCLIGAAVERHPELVIAHNDRDFTWIGEVSDVRVQRFELS